MKTLLLCFFLLAPLSAQCSRGNHPPGVFSVLGAGPGCNEIDGTGTTTWFSMWSVPRQAGGPVSFSYLGTPSAGNRPAFAVGFLVLSVNASVPGIRVPRTADPNCLWNVSLDVVLPELVPLLPGCQVRQLLTLPPLPGLVGAAFFAQTWAQDLTNNKSMVTNPLLVVVQP